MKTPTNTKTMSKNEKTPETDDSTARVIKAGISPIIDYCYALDMRKMEIERNEARAQAENFRKEFNETHDFAVKLPWDA
jgi:ABC-type uncharacterized transport system auxiliary subunit